MWLMTRHFLFFLSKTLAVEFHKSYFLIFFRPVDSLSALHWILKVVKIWDVAIRLYKIFFMNIFGITARQIWSLLMLCLAEDSSPFVVEDFAKDLCYKLNMILILITWKTVLFFLIVAYPIQPPSPNNGFYYIQHGSKWSLLNSLEANDVIKKWKLMITFGRWRHHPWSHSLKFKLLFWKEFALIFRRLGNEAKCFMYFEQRISFYWTQKYEKSNQEIRIMFNFW